MQNLEAYARLFSEEDAKGKEEVYAPFEREQVRMQLHRALSQHVLGEAAQGHADEMRSYFDNALNRARSAVTHNVFDRLETGSSSNSVLLFGRFDSGHDGVLEFGDFCRVMLLVGERVGATYKEAQMQRMFSKADLNGDRLLDLNEFLWLVQGLVVHEGAASGRLLQTRTTWCSDGCAKRRPRIPLRTRTATPRACNSYYAPPPAVQRQLYVLYRRVGLGGDVRAARRSGLGSLQNQTGRRTTRRYCNA